MKKQPSLLKQLFVFAGNYKYLSILSVIFAGISALATTLMKLAYAGEPQLQLKDALTFFMYLLVVSEMYDSRLRCRIFPRLSQPIPSANVWMRFFPARNRPVNPLWITRDMTSLSELQIKSQYCLSSRHMKSSND